MTTTHLAVHPEDVERILAREFHSQDQNEAKEILFSYGTESFHKEVPRVQLAAIRLAEGCLRRLEDEINAACQDPREVLAWAESPTFMSLTPESSEREKALVIKEDLEDYKEWLEWGD